MKIEITWDAADVWSTRRILDRNGSKCVIVQSIDVHQENRWSVYREADGFIWKPCSLPKLVAGLNALGFRPEYIK